MRATNGDPTFGTNGRVVVSFDASSEANDVAIQTDEKIVVMRAVAEDADFRARKFNRAFVFMQYLGYLRRRPNDPPDINFDGYNFWLTKLNQFNGNFIEAEMVKAFILSGEYRGRFGP